MICSANQLTGFYMMATLAFNELRKEKIYGAYLCSILAKTPLNIYHLYFKMQSYFAMIHNKVTLAF